MQQGVVLLALQHVGHQDAHLGTECGVMADQPLHDAAGEIRLELQRRQIDQPEFRRVGEIERQPGIGLVEGAVGQRVAEQRLDLGVEAVARFAQQGRTLERQRAGLRQPTAGIEGAVELFEARRIGHRAAIVAAVERRDPRVGGLLAQNGQRRAGGCEAGADGEVAAGECLARKQAGGRRQAELKDSALGDQARSTRGADRQRPVAAAADVDRLPAGLAEHDLDRARLQTGEAESLGR